MAQPYIGEIRLFAGSFAPVGWMLCDGQVISIAENETLFNLIGTTYGGDGQLTFALPDAGSHIAGFAIQFSEQMFDADFALGHPGNLVFELFQGLFGRVQFQFVLVGQGQNLLGSGVADGMYPRPEVVAQQHRQANASDRSGKPQFTNSFQHDTNSLKKFRSS